ncbi:hypothetical protein ACWEQ8_20800 [Streptomyces noursei]
MLTTIKSGKAARTVAGLGLAAVLVATGSSTAFAAAPPSTLALAAPYQLSDSWRDVAVQYADNHWNWTAWNDPTAVQAGEPQPKFQCAEFVARALAEAGLIPGLKSDAPQDSYYHYKAPNGKEYDLLLISDQQGYQSLYDFLMDFHLGTDIGNQPNQAQPGDMVVTFDRASGQKLHTGLIAQAAEGVEEPTVDAHNNARYRYGYHNYDVAGEAHIIRINPQALATVRGVPQPNANPNLTRSNADPVPAL